MAVMTNPKKGRGRPPKHNKPATASRSGRTVNVTFSPETFAALEEFLGSFEFSPPRSEVVDGFVASCLRERGFPRKKDAP